MKLASLAPRDAHEKALKACRGHGLPYRPERRLVDTEAARARVAAGFRRTEQSHVTRLKDGLALSREDRRVLSLRNRGLWPSEIAVVLRIRVQSVRYRLERLKKAGFSFTPPTAPRTHSHRKVTDDEVLTLAMSGLSIPEIAARVGMATAVHKRIKRLQERDCGN
jgi:DNA-binding CsgD family transcriptional regulator